jgi:hypothetical protein
MAATVITGRALTLTIDGDNWSSQTAECTLTPTQSATQYITLSDSAAIVAPATWELTVRSFQDWDQAASLFEGLWTAATAGTAVAFSMVVSGGGTFSGDLIPVFPTAGGAADSALESDITFPVNGAVTYTP